MKDYFIVLGVCVGLFCNLSFSASLSDEQQSKLGIRTTTLVADDVLAYHRYLGQVQFAPNSQQTLSKPYNLQVKRWLVAVGDRVKTGQGIAEVYIPEMVNLEHEYHRLLSAVKLAKQKQHREQTLLSQGVVSQKQYQQTQSELSQLSEQLDTIHNKLALMGVSEGNFATLNHDQHLNGCLTITSLADGVLTEITAGLNQSLAENAGLVTLITNQTLLIHIPVPPIIAQNLKVGQTLRLEDGTLATLQAIQQQVSDAQKMIIIAGVQHPNLKAGQWVKVIFPNQDQVIQWRVSRQSVTYINNQPHLLVIKQGEVRSVPVSLVNATREGWIVRSEFLTSDMAVVVSGTAAVKAMLVDGE